MHRHREALGSGQSSVSCDVMQNLTVCMHSYRICLRFFLTLWLSNEMFARRLLLRPLLPPHNRPSAAPPRRHALHLPLLAGAGKVLAGAGLKKLALNSIVRKLVRRSEAQTVD